MVKFQKPSAINFLWEKHNISIFIQKFSAFLQNTLFTSKILRLISRCSMNSSLRSEHILEFFISSHYYAYMNNSKSETDENLKIMLNKFLFIFAVQNKTDWSGPITWGGVWVKGRLLKKDYESLQQQFARAKCVRW